MVTQVKITALDHSEQDTLDRLLVQLDAKAGRNRLRAQYYDGKYPLKDLGISTPPTLRRMNTVLGWPAKAVDVLNRRCVLDGFSLPTGDVDAWGIPDLLVANNFDSEMSQAGVSSLIHSVAWLITTRGDTASGEPPVVITARDAMSGTGLWDPRRRTLSAFLSIIDRDQAGDITEMVMYLPTSHVSMTKTDTRGWSVARETHSLNRVPVEPYIYRPRLGRPFGSSRISRAVMSLTDMALRTIVRSEISAEFYSAPQRYLLGADEKAFVGPDGAPTSQWKAIMGRVWAIDRDEEGNLPQVGQFTQMSQQPHMDQLRALAQLFAGETSIPISSLGISTDSNPTSAEAYRASRDDLIQEAEGATTEWGPTLPRTIRTAIQIRDRLDEPPAELLGLRPRWRDPSTPSQAAAADAFAKLVAVIPELANTPSGLARAGLSADEITEVLASRRRSTGASSLRSMLTGATGGDSGAGDTAPS